MAGQRRINIGTDATDARYVLEDDGPGGDLVVKDTDNADREVFRYDGTADEFELRDATADAIKTEQLQNADGITEPTFNINWERPLWGSEQETTIAVPGDEPTIQDALRKAPHILQANFTIRIDESEGPYNEDIIVPGVHTIQSLTNQSQGPLPGLYITNTSGSPGTNPQAAIQSAFFLPSTGETTLQNVEIQDSTPYADESGGVMLRGSRFLRVREVTFTGAAPSGQAFVVYGPGIIYVSDNVDIGADVVTNAFHGKLAGRIFAKSSMTGGSATRAVAQADLGMVHIAEGCPVTAPDRVVRSDTDGLVVDNEAGTFFTGAPAPSVEFDRSGDSASTAAGTFINLFDSDLSDPKGLSSGGQFTPTVGGLYDFDIVARLEGSTAAGDTITARLQDVDAGSTVVQTNLGDSTGSTAITPWSFKRELTAGTTYEVQIRNFDSSYIVKAGTTTGNVSLDSV
jgi:hypothetical protein